jgi:hypothetical protein
MQLFVCDVDCLLLDCRLRARSPFPVLPSRVQSAGRVHWLRGVLRPVPLLGRLVQLALVPVSVPAFVLLVLVLIVVMVAMMCLPRLVGLVVASVLEQGQLPLVRLQ